MFEMLNLEKLFLYIPGILIFLVGSSQTRIFLRKKRAGKSINGTVADCKSIVKKDHKGRNIYDYYLITVEFVQPLTKKTEKISVKSPTKYVKGQPVTLFKNSDHKLLSKQEITICDSEDISLFQPWEMMIGGALLILLAYYQNEEDPMKVMFCLALLLIGAGLSLTVQYILDQRKKIQKLDAEIIEIYGRQLTTDSKLIKSGRNTFYPVVQYELNGKVHIRRCHVNSNDEKTFQVGAHMTLYQDADTMLITEKRRKIGTLVAGIVLLLIGILAGGGLWVK